MYLNVYSICTTWATLLLVNVYSNSVRNILYTQFRKILLLSHTFCIPFCSCHHTWEIYQYRVSLSTTTSSPSWFTGTCKASRYHSNPRGLSTTQTCSCYWTQSARKHSLILDPLSQEMTLMVFLDLSQKVWIFLNCTKHVHTYVLAWYYILCIIVYYISHVKDRCPRSDQMSPTPHYQSVCGIGGGLPCRCAEYGAFEPAECCTAEGTLDRSEKCNGKRLICTYVYVSLQLHIACICPVSAVSCPANGKDCHGWIFIAH